MPIGEILYIAGVAVAIGASIVSTIVTLKGNKNSKKKSERTVETGKESPNGNTENVSTQVKQESFWSVLWQKLPNYIIAAEDFYNKLVPNSMIKTGAQKLAHVLDKVKIECLTNGVEYNEQKATDMVNELVDFTNSVNTNKN